MRSLSVVIWRGMHNLEDDDEDENDNDSYHTKPSPHASYALMARSRETRTKSSLIGCHTNIRSNGS